LESFFFDLFRNSVQYLQTSNPLVVYFCMFAIAFTENIFPPSPSDLVIVFGGALVAIGHLGFIPALFSATAGSVAGFVVMYLIGGWFGDHILEQGKVKFIKVETVNRVEEWFRKHGYWVIVINRFLTGTRAVVSFFAGMSEMNLPLTITLCAISALTWNAILVTTGYYLGQNWEQIGSYLRDYGRAVTVIVVLIVSAVTIRYFIRRRRTEGNPQ
jgi:membrane protein DedA with SNARE-associated domain